MPRRLLMFLVLLAVLTFHIGGCPTPSEPVTPTPTAGTRTATPVPPTTTPPPGSATATPTPPTEPVPSSTPTAHAELQVVPDTRSPAGLRVVGLAQRPDTCESNFRVEATAPGRGPRLLPNGRRLTG